MYIYIYIYIYADTLAFSCGQKALDYGGHCRQRERGAPSGGRLVVAIDDVTGA
jgi:hypothetical protein